MNRFGRRLAAATGTLAVVSALGTGTAQAQDSGPLYFGTGAFQCAIFADGAVGCDAPGYRLQYTWLPVPFPVNEVVIDQPWLPAHPTFTPGSDYTRPGNNPSLYEVRTGDGTWGPYVEYAGARCEAGFHGSFTCSSKGRAFSAYNYTITA
ncbi:hypothetical protein [Nocardia bovistercoris]|uniref:Ig-like domain-containing protein n=1 Tax=Nocardia bovistercoris TaxID=2785916 RepID=A0A931IEY6_9NOCA|nr:hypothetical protein [Nocardia bovistercoris]MBH0780011.1 hypothetical protein [Nocardia bovistercoris]